MRGNILGVERRRRWSEERKLSIISEVGVGGASVAQVAQRHEITRQQIYAWRHELRRKGLWSAEIRRFSCRWSFNQRRTGHLSWHLCLLTRAS